jgi:hypothetical protein
MVISAELWGNGRKTDHLEESAHRSATKSLAVGILAKELHLVDWSELCHLQDR